MSPAAACRFYSLGACRRRQCLSPGHDRNQACLRLDKLVRDWDDFLDRAEAFGLSEPEAARIWNRREHKSLYSTDVCAHTRPAVDGAPQLLDCAYIDAGACLLRMPRCLGRCEYYQCASSFTRWRER